LSLLLLSQSRKQLAVKYEVAGTAGLVMHLNAFVADCSAVGSHHSPYRFLDLKEILVIGTAAPHLYDEATLPYDWGTFEQ